MFKAVKYLLKLKLEKFREKAKPPTKQYWKWTWWRIGYALEWPNEDWPVVVGWKKIIGPFWWKIRP